MRNYRRGVRRRASAAGVVAALLVASGCGDSDAPSHEPPRGDPGFALDGFDYDPVNGPKALAGISDLAVEGRISEFSSGRSYGDPKVDGLAHETAVMTVAVDRVHLGELPKDAEDNVYIELLGAEDPDTVAKALPVGSRTLLYLAELAPEGVVPGPVTDQGAGLAAGQPLFAFANPQGLLLEVEGGVSQPAAPHEFPNAALAQFYPDEQRFPPEAADR